MLIIDTKLHLTICRNVEGHLAGPPLGAKATQYYDSELVWRLVGTLAQRVIVFIHDSATRSVSLDSLAEVAEWQTRRSQKPLGINARVGSNPTFGTNLS